MQIKMSNLNYNFDNNGNTTSINISFSGNEGSNFISATMVVTPDDLPQGVDTLDDLNRKQVQELGRARYIASRDGVALPRTTPAPSICALLTAVSLA